MDTRFTGVVKQIISYYPFKVENISLLSYKGEKAVWAIQTNLGEVIMKKIPMSEERLKFMIHAIDFLKANGVYTPGVFKTNTGDGYVSLNGEHFIVLEAVRGRSPEYEFDEDLLRILRGMALFHKASKGIEVPSGMKATSHLGEWRLDFKKRYEMLLEWKKQRSNAKELSEFDRQFLLHVDVFLEQCQKSLSLLDQSYYDKWVEQCKTNKLLNHQDYAAGNLTICDDGNLYVYDMDSLTIDLPVRDMRKILNKVMKKRTHWEEELMMKMMKAYQEVNPLSKEEYLVLAADILFPHLFFGQVSKYYQNREKNWTVHKHLSRLNDMISTELSKEAVLHLFLNNLNEVSKHG